MYEVSQFKDAASKVFQYDGKLEDEIVQNFQKLLKYEMKSSPKGIIHGKRNIMVRSRLSLYKFLDQIV